MVDDGRVTSRILGGGELVRESVGFGIVGTRSVGDSELKHMKEKTAGRSVP